MKRSVVASIAVLPLVVAGCSSSDPTASDEYQTLEQELAQAESELVLMTAERDELEATVSAAPEGEGSSVSAPAELVALTDDWYAANDRGDGSVLDLDVPEGYHLFGDQRFEYDEIVNHLSGGSIEVEHEWITEPLLIAEDDDGRYVVVRGMGITSAIGSHASAFLFEIVTTPEGELRIVQTAWFYDTEW